MAIIVVGGSTKGAGKTTLVCGLIAALPEFRWTAIKITTHDHSQPQPIWEETKAGQGTDTARYLAAGAERALMVTPTIGAAESDLSLLLDELRSMRGPASNVIFESNSILEHVQPDLCLMVLAVRDADGKSLMKSFKLSFMQFAPHADSTVMRCAVDGVTWDATQSSARPPTPTFYLASLEKISPEMLAWIKQRLPAPPQPNA